MKKTISLVLVFSILTLSIQLTAKEGKGADLIVMKNDGTQVRGELIAVKESSFLLQERDSGADLSVDIQDVGTIIIVKKSKSGLGVVLGLLIGGGAGGAIGSTMASSEWFGGVIPTIMGAVVGAFVGMFIGSFIGKGAGKGKAIQFEGKPDYTIKQHLIELRKKARIKNFQ